jgi:hypothetical protein
MFSSFLYITFGTSETWSERNQRTLIKHCDKCWTFEIRVFRSGLKIRSHHTFGDELLCGISRLLWFICSTRWSSISSGECCGQNAAFTGSGAIWARVSPEGIRSRHYPLISAGKLNLRQLNTLSYWIDLLGCWLGDLVMCLKWYCTSLLEHQRLGLSVIKWI